MASSVRTCLRLRYAPNPNENEEPDGRALLLSPTRFGNEQLPHRGGKLSLPRAMRSPSALACMSTR